MKLFRSLTAVLKRTLSAFPIACFYFQSYNLSRDLSAKKSANYILIIVLAFSLLAVKRKNILMYFAASSLAGFEIILLLVLQLTIGNMYQLSGIIIASLMAGLAAGSGSGLRITREIPVKVISLCSVIFLCGYCLLP